MSWQALATASPALAEFGARRFDKGVAYLATVKKDGTPVSHRWRR